MTSRAERAAYPQSWIVNTIASNSGRYAASIGQLTKTPVSYCRSAIALLARFRGLCCPTRLAFGRFVRGLALQALGNDGLHVCADLRARVARAGPRPLLNLTPWKLFFRHIESVPRTIITLAEGSLPNV